MELSKIPYRQLFEIKKAADSEIKRRKRDNLEEYKKLMVEYNDTFDQIPQQQSGNLAIPNASLIGHHNDRRKYLDALLSQSWCGLFAGENLDATPCYYVYAHIDPSAKQTLISRKFGGVVHGTPFYIGKGMGNRAYDLKRNQAHLLRIKDVKRAGIPEKDIVHFFKRGLTEIQALELESKLIYYFGTIYEKNRRGILVNLDIGRRPNFCGEMEKIVIKRAKSDG